MAATKFTLDLVHTATTFELRQELVRRQAFVRFFPKEDKASFDTLLKANVQLLREDQLADERVRFEAHNKKVDAQRAQLEQDKEARKREATDRSRARQAAAALAKIAPAPEPTQRIEEKENASNLIAVHSGYYR